MLYKSATLDVRHDADASRQKLTAALAELAARAKPDDTLVVFFAGHGDLLMPKDGPLPGAGRAALAGEGNFYFCGPDYTPAKPGATALAVEELFVELAKINCRKVVLIDACRCAQPPAPVRAERAGAGHHRRVRPERAVLRRPAVQARAVHLRGARRARPEQELPQGGLQLRWPALALSPEELFEYVAVKVPALVRQLGKPGETQTPICFPRQLPKYALFKP